VEIENDAGVCIRHALAMPCGSASRPISDATIIEKARRNLEGNVEDPDRFLTNFLKGIPEGDYPLRSKSLIGSACRR